MDLWLEFAKQVPSLAVLATIVVLFLHYLQSRDKIYDERLMSMTQLFTKTATEGHEVAAELAKALGELRIEIARSNDRVMKH